MTNVPDDVLKAAEYVRGMYQSILTDPGRPSAFERAADLLAAYVLGPDLIQCQVKYLPGEDPTTVDKNE